MCSVLFLFLYTYIYELAIELYVKRNPVGLI